MKAVYEENSSKNPEYKLNVIVFNDAPDEYYPVILKHFPATEDFWLTQNMGYHKIKPGDFNYNNFQRVYPPSFSSIEEAIIHGKELLKQYENFVET